MDALGRVVGGGGYGHLVAVEVCDRFRVVDGPDVLALIDKDRLLPPSMHFLTQSAPVPACLAPHIESEIQPLILVESAALAASAVRANAATATKGDTLHEEPPGEWGITRTATIMRVLLPVGQGNKAIALFILKFGQPNFYWLGRQHVRGGFRQPS